MNHSLQLPQRDADLYNWARGVAPLFDRGPRAAFLNATSRQRYAGPGELSGQSDVGRLRDIRIARSYLRGQAIYRYREVSPERQAMVISDLRDIAHNQESCRLVSTAVAVAVVLSATPELQLTWAAFGADRSVPPIVIESSRPAHLLRGAAQAMLNFKQDPQRRALRKQEGQIRRLMAFSPDAHLVVVSHHIEPELFRRLPYTYGATVFLVEAGSDGIRNPRGGYSLNGLLAPGLAGNLNLRFQAIAQSLRGRRSDCLAVAAEGELLGAITNALGGRARSATG